MMMHRMRACRKDKKMSVADIYRNKIALFICAAVIISSLAGCSDEKKTDVNSENQTMVMQYGDNIVTVGEVYIYIRTVQERYELQYGEDVWQLTLDASGTDAVSMVSLTKQAVVEEIVKVKTLVVHAQDYGIAFTDEELSEIDAKAKEFYDGLTDEDISSMELTLDKVYQVLYENELAGRVEEKILETDPVEISDETARMTTFFDMYFQCYSIDENGTVTEYTDEEKNEQYENALQACSTLATATIDENKDAENIEKLAEYYKLTQAGEQTLSPEDILETYGDTVYELLYSMENGDYSTVVETEYGYHVFQMIALTDQRATQARKETLTREAVRNKLSDVLTEWQREIDPEFSYPESVNMEVYDTIEID